MLLWYSKGYFLFIGILVPIHCWVEMLLRRKRNSSNSAENELSENNLICQKKKKVEYAGCIEKI